MPLSYIEIDRTAIVGNIAALGTLVRPEVAVLAVVKGNAYGHGLRECVQAMEGIVDGFQVDDIEELRVLRATTDSRALVLGYVAESDVEEAVRLGGELALYDVERLRALQNASERLGVQARVHLKVDNLLGRQGILPGEVPCFLTELEKYSGVRLVAAYGHFANIEDSTSLEHAHRQIAIFDATFRHIQERFPEAGRHLSSTAGAMTLEGEGSSNDLVRLGVGVYGMYPSEDLKAAYPALTLRPAMRWISHLAQVKDIPAGHPVGYGLTYVADRKLRVGIVPQGYSDGYDRGLSNSGRVLVNGSVCPVIGRVAMNMFAIDLTASENARPEDEVVLLGDSISAEELARLTGTINYEVTTRISPLLPRVCV